MLGWFVTIAKVADLEGTIKGKDQIINHFKNQAALSPQDIAQLLSTKIISDVPPSPIEPDLPMHQTKSKFNPKTS